MQTGWGYTDSNTMASCISKHELEGVGLGGGCLAMRQTLFILGTMSSSLQLAVIKQGLLP